MTKYKKGKIVKGAVTGIESYGIFVSLDEFYSGLIHISEISHNYVKNINDHVSVGDIIYVEVLDVDEKLAQLKLSIKNIDYKKNNNFRKRKIKETNSGFSTLSKMLPIWIEENIRKNSNFVDK
ncbi:MAG: CvfD/Ygs/GSP13 family RNA-binding post-transcriptional regulator [Bacilli bacterium]|nr:CvfD/Ygs/GSP13 family RNA-binding post-transcriptional regulator [Bacilli bacterium]MDD4547295.1 CvfD/Ygs/GSP13 family RNA-binding post-transcriptional regulator [Bacilli bacterium]